MTTKLKAEWIALLASKLAVNLMVAEELLSQAQERMEQACDEQWELDAIDDQSIFENAIQYHRENY